MSSFYTPRTSLSPPSSTSSPNEIRIELPSQGTATDRATQEGRNSTNVMTLVNVNEMYRTLFDAIRKGDRNAVRRLVNEDANALRATIVTISGQDLDALGVAIATSQDELVEYLVTHMSDRLSISFDALSAAAKRGRIRIVKAFLKDRRTSLSSYTKYALMTAILNAPKEKELIWHMTRHLLGSPIDNTVITLITVGHPDIGLYLVRKHPSLHVSKKIIGHLTSMASLFRSGAQLTFWDRCIYKCISICLIDMSHDNSEDTEMGGGTFVYLYKWFRISLWKLATKSDYIKRIGELKWMHHSTLKLASAALEEMENRMTAPELLDFFWTSTTLLLAVHWGISELVILCVERHPELLWNADFAKELMEATMKIRNVELFNLLNTHIVMSRSHVMEPSSLINAVVQWAPGCQLNVVGAAFFLQRELQWFKMVEDMNSPLPSTERKLYHDDFLGRRQDIIKEAKEWIKHMSSSCSILAILMLTVTMTAVITVPGGNDSSTGSPIHVFSIGNGLAFFFSSCANLIFLAILTSRYVADDFRYSLPKKLILGLTFLFLSLAAMLAGFSSAFILSLSNRDEWIPIPVILMGGLLISLFTILQLPLYIEMVKSTFWPLLFRSP